MTDNTDTTEGAERSSARIYQFPPRGRMSNREMGRADFTTGSRYLAAAAGDSWYHQAAIDEEKH